MKKQTDHQKIETALSIILRYGQIDGAHHKAWVIDQVTRVLLGDKYDTWIKDYKHEEDDPNAYDWDVGIAP
jgi:hypothetical protein